MFDITEISASNVRDFVHLAQPEYRGRLLRIGSNSSEIALGASIFVKSVGLLYARKSRSSKYGSVYNIKSLYVSEKYRNRGIGTALLRTAQKKAAERQKRLLLIYPSLETILSSNTEQTEPDVVETMLKKSGWSPPILHSIVTWGDQRVFSRAPWFNKYRLSPAYDIALWSSLSKTEKADLQRRLEETPCQPEYLSPFLLKENSMVFNSVGLRHQGRIVGWMLTKGIAGDTILYSRAYVIPELQKLGKYFTQLVSTAINHAAQQGVYKGAFCVAADNIRMRALVERHMKAYLADAAERYVSSPQRLPA